MHAYPWLSYEMVNMQAFFCQRIRNEDEKMKGNPSLFKHKCTFTWLNRKCKPTLLFFCIKILCILSTYKITHGVTCTQISTVLLHCLFSWLGLNHKALSKTWNIDFFQQVIILLLNGVHLRTKHAFFAIFLDEERVWCIIPNCLR